ncbi:MAG TPA: sodium-dependent bicarbonate transport family permease [Gammaproteobacteria bacterium]|nr:sodium-dependent bicarbonate transport family permease [Gammaproteobacteria bacterium]
MESSPLLDPSVLFFILGLFAGLVRSNLEVPIAIARFLSLYLLMALGLKGGFSLAESGFNPAILRDLIFAIGLALTIPFFSFVLLKRVINPLDALAISATYGSVSAVTFITATQFLETNGLEYGGHMAAAMALMESPAIIFAILMANFYRSQEARKEHEGLSVVLKESFTEGAQILLLGAMVIGIVTGGSGKTIMDPFTGMIFKGMLAFFLLDMGVATAKRLTDLRNVPKRLVFYGALAPITHAFIALLLSWAGGLSVANATLLAVLAGSASYIAVPAVLKHALPESNPSLYLGLSLGLTFPFNIIVGIPLYYWAASQIIGG